MPNTNKSTNKYQKINAAQTAYSRPAIIKIFSQLCSPAYSLKNNAEQLILSKPSLLASTNENNTDLSNRFSFFCSNPTGSKAFYDSSALHKWQSQLPRSNQHLDKNQSSATEIPFHSGWLGYFAYPNPTEAASAINAQPADAIAEFNYYPWTICFDHLHSTLHLLGSPTILAKHLFELLETGKVTAQPQSLPTPDNNFTSTDFAPLWDMSRYSQAFDRVKHYLISGDCYQINLTQAYKAQYQGYASTLLAPLFEQMQPNFGGYFKGLDVELISLSPERFISISSQGRLEAKPIKGTIKRSNEKNTDQRLIDELSNSSKNKAENLMIVDLLRNDLSMSALTGTVKVEELFALESHPNVHHLVSTISAQLKTEVSPATAIGQAFPGGSITGAPKIRAMEIIAELEAEPRSLYCGSLGYFADNGSCDFNILIRNLEFRKGTITCWGGGGITIDSELNDEYEESIMKIQRIMDIVEEQSFSKP
jgi:para-aminobenzoate synthetase component 1